MFLWRWQPSHVAKSQSAVKTCTHSQVTRLWFETSDHHDSTRQGSLVAFCDQVISATSSFTSQSVQVGTQLDVQATQQRPFNGTGGAAQLSCGASVPSQQLLRPALELCLLDGFAAGCLTASWHTCSAVQGLHKEATLVLHAMLTPICSLWLRLQAVAMVIRLLLLFWRMFVVAADVLCKPKKILMPCKTASLGTLFWGSAPALNHRLYGACRFWSWCYRM